MALGSNLKKKQLIPDPEEKTAEKKQSAKKKPAKKTAKAKTTATKTKTASAKAKARPKKKTTTEAKQAKSTAVKPKAVSKTKIAKPGVPKEAAPPPESPKVEEVIQQADVLPSPVATGISEPAQYGREPIISAYSVYIAQELHERKTALRKQYLNEISQLQGKPIQFILVTIGTERYALEIDCVKEVVPLPTISKTPNTPDHIKGVVNVRGNTYVVFDLATKFKVIAQEVPRYLLVLSDQGLKSSVPLSVLPTTFKTNGNQISHSLQIIEDTLLDASYIKGIIQNEEELIYYLDIVELLRNDKAIVMPDNLVEEK